MEENNFNIGTSGWSFTGWLGNFYPEKIKSNLILPYYATLLDSVELNNSFYQIPKKKNVDIWKEITPEHFVFSCKANRYITHLKKLEDTTETVEKLLDAFSNLKKSWGLFYSNFRPIGP